MRHLAALLPLLVVAAACNTNATDADNLTLNQDVATVTADAAAQDVELMRGPGGHLGMRLPADPSRFECTSDSREGLTVERSCVFKDAGGAVQSGYDPTSTASVTVHAKVDGSIDRGHWSGEIHRVRDFTVSGLAGAETKITWNGTGSGTSSGVHPKREGTSVTYSMTEHQTVTNVVIPVPRTETSWPLSGSIASNVTAKMGDSTRVRNSVITFNGTQYATVVVNGDSFQFDLAARGRAHHGGGHP